MSSDGDHDDDVDPLGGDGSAFMSLLNSYYDAAPDQGDAATGGRNEELDQGNEDDIDSPQFRGDLFVKVSGGALII
jgi:hypothetical protein